MRFELVIMFIDVHWMILQLYSSWFEELCMNSISENFVWDDFSWLSCSGSWSTVDLWFWFKLHVVVDVSSFLLQKEWMNLVKNQERNCELKWALGADFSCVFGVVVGRLKMMMCHLLIGCGYVWNFVLCMISHEFISWSKQL